MNISQIASHIENNKVDNFINNVTAYIEMNREKFQCMLNSNLTVKQNLILCLLKDCDFEHVSTKFQQITGWGSGQFWMRPGNACKPNTLLGQLLKEEQIKAEHFVELFKMFETYNERVNFFLESLFTIDEIVNYFPTNFKIKYFQYNQNRVAIDKDFCLAYIAIISVSIPMLDQLAFIYPDIYDEQTNNKFVTQFYYNLLISNHDKSKITIDWFIKHYKIFLNIIFKPYKQEIIFGLKTQHQISKNIDSVLIRNIFKKLES